MRLPNWPNRQELRFELHCEVPSHQKPKARKPRPSHFSRAHQGACPTPFTNTSTMHCHGTSQTLLTTPEAHSNEIICPRCSAMEQESPTQLHVRNQKYAVQQRLMVFAHLLQLVLDEIWVPERRSQDLDPLLNRACLVASSPDPGTLHHQQAPAGTNRHQQAPTRNKKQQQGTTTTTTTTTTPEKLAKTLKHYNWPNAVWPNAVNTLKH